MKGQLKKQKRLERQLELLKNFPQEIDHYEKDKGVLIQTPHTHKGVANLAQGVVKTAQRGANLADKEEPFNKNQEEDEHLSLKRKELLNKYKPDFLKKQN